MDIKHLVYFITLAEERNMTKAAEKLYISQSTLSYILSKLETELGKPLFLRAKKEMASVLNHRPHKEHTDAHQYIYNRADDRNKTAAAEKCQRLSLIHI